MKAKRESNKNVTSLEEIEQYKLLYPLLSALLSEMKELSKKKQDGALNLMKVQLANKILSKVKQLLREEPTNEFLDVLDEEKLPTNSDAVLIISQFKASMDRYRSKYTSYSSGSHVWNVSDNQEDENDSSELPF